MAEALKTKGREELAAFRKRVIRQYGSDAISRSTYDKLIAKVDELDAFVVSMDEVIPRTLIKRKAR